MSRKKMIAEVAKALAMHGMICRYCRGTVLTRSLVGDADGKYTCQRCKDKGR